MFWLFFAQENLRHGSQPIHYETGINFDLALQLIVSPFDFDWVLVDPLFLLALVYKFSLDWNIQ